MCALAHPSSPVCSSRRLRTREQQQSQVQYCECCPSEVFPSSCSGFRRRKIAIPHGVAEQPAWIVAQLQIDEARRFDIDPFDLIAARMQAIREIETAANGDHPLDKRLRHLQ